MATPTSRSLRFALQRLIPACAAIFAVSLAVTSLALAIYLAHRDWSTISAIAIGSASVAAASILAIFATAMFGQATAGNDVTVLVERSDVMTRAILGAFLTRPLLLFLATGGLGLLLIDMHFSGQVQGAAIVSQFVVATFGLLVIAQGRVKVPNEGDGAANPTRLWHLIVRDHPRAAPLPLFIIGVGTASFSYLVIVLLAVSARVFSPSAFEPDATVGSLFRSGLPGRILVRELLGGVPSLDIPATIGWDLATPRSAVLGWVILTYKATVVASSVALFKRIRIVRKGSAR